MDDKIQLLSGKSGEKDVFIDAQELVTGRTCVIGQSGSGKSYFIAVLCEQLLQNNIAFCIVDTEGEYFSLKEKFQMLWIGGEEADVNIGIDFNDLIAKSIKNNVSLILDVSDVMDQRKVVTDFASKLYEIENQVRQPYLLIVEEADKFVPQSKDSLKEIEEISKRGRKRGLGLLVATQRPSLVNKNVLSQCGNQFIGKLTTENDLKAVDLFFTDRKELELLPKLNTGEFFVMGNTVKEKTRMKAAQRITQHKGLTPKLIQKATGKITDLKTSLGVVERTGESEETEKVPEARETGGVKLNGIGANILKEQIEAIIEEKKKKKYLLFGEKEHVKSIELIHHPFAWVEINSPEGFIMKSIASHSFIVDAVSGEFADIKNGLKYSTGLSRLVGLNENEIRILLEIFRNNKITIGDLELKTSLSEATIRNIIHRLQDRKTVTFSKEGNLKLYSFLINFEIPDIKQTYSCPEIRQISGKANTPVLTEETLRQIIKGIDGDADITKFELFYYPIWFVALESRKLRIDSVTGKEIGA
ncbi:DNA double-strand break repair helicase HerA [uncultured archaeon]|nr:DNA double-strand break repair helicase HerA [uncultured archaeon]